MACYRVRAISLSGRYSYPQDPMLWDDIVEKYLECAGYAKLAQRGVDPKHLIALVEDIESLQDGTQLMASLSPAR